MIDPTATQPVPIRCVCPPLDGKPRHPDGDTIDVRSQYGYGDSLALSKRSVRYKIGQHPKTGEPLVLPYDDAFEQHEALLELGVKAWSITDAAGEQLPVALSTILLLPDDVGEQLAVAINAFYEASRGSVPNGSGAPSPATSPVISAARPNRATRRSRKPSTRR